MDQTIGIYLLLAFVVIVPIVWFFVRRRVMAKVRSAGAQSGVNLEHRITAGEVGKRSARLRFTDGAAGRRIVDEVFSASKDITVTGPASWTLRHVNPDDVALSWTVDADGGAVLRVERAREMLGQLVGGRVWTKLVARIEAATRAHPARHVRLFLRRQGVRAPRRDR